MTFKDSPDGRCHHTGILTESQYHAFRDKVIDSLLVLREFEHVGIALALCQADADVVTLAVVFPDAVLIGLVYLQYHLLPSGITTQVMDGIVPELTGIVLADEIFLGERPCYQSVVEELLQAFCRVDDAKSEMLVGGKQDGMIVKQCR